MRIGYNILKLYVKIGLFCYFKKIKVVGLGNIPKDKPILFLANHQNALIDALIIVMNVGVAPFFLARSDVFKKPLIAKFLRYLQMIPIYRIRDGRETLKNNPAIFSKCGRLLSERKALMLFPEGNHGIQRRVRWPMRKGFVKMIFSSLENDPNLDIRIVPVGLNYLRAESFPDSVAMYIGEDISVQACFDPKNLPATEALLKNEVYKRLKQLTTHIEDEGTYDNVVVQLNNRNVDYLDPISVNNAIQEIDVTFQETPIQKKTPWYSYVLKFVFTLVNFPILVLWNKKLKSRDMDIEFRSTMRFALGVLLFPIYFGILFLLFAYFLGIGTAFMLLLVHWFINVAYVKLG